MADVAGAASQLNVIDATDSGITYDLEMKGADMEDPAIKGADMEDPAIKIDDVSMVFDSNDGTKVNALEHVSLDVKKGEFISLVGPSGCGKTTLLRMISNLEEPTDGEIHVMGMTPREVSCRRLNFVMNAELKIWCRMYCLV